MQPYAQIMQEVLKYYSFEETNYTGNNSTAHAYAAIFEDGKQIYTQNCLSCHGCSGNGQGPYARHLITQPANLHERILSYLPEPGDPYHFWRISEGVPGTAMPPWKLSMNETDRWKIAFYEMSFAMGAIRTISGDASDEEADNFSRRTNIIPPISGSQEEFETGKQLYVLYCAQCHGIDGHGDGITSILETGGYISPEPANFTESGADFKLYGRYVWKVTEGVETTNMPPWKYALNDDEIFVLIFYIQNFSVPEDYNEKWGPLYADTFARNLKRDAYE